MEAGDHGQVEMLWAVDVATDTAYWWCASEGWCSSTMTNGVLAYFEKCSHLEPVSLYQVKHMNPKAYKPNATTN